MSGKKSKAPSRSLFAIRPFREWAVSEFALLWLASVRPVLFVAGLTEAGPGSQTPATTKPRHYWGMWLLSPGGFHLFVDEPDELFEELQVFGARDLLHLTDELASAFDEIHAVFDSEFFHRAARSLHLEQFLHLVGAQCGGSVAVAFEPGNESWQRGALVEEFQQLLIGWRLAVHARQKPVEWHCAQLANR